MTGVVVSVRGNPSAAEVAAVLATVRRPSAAPADPYRRWRATRRAALHDLAHDRTRSSGPVRSR